MIAQMNPIKDKQNPASRPNPQDCPSSKLLAEVLVPVELVDTTSKSMRASVNFVVMSFVILI